MKSFSVDQNFSLIIFNINSHFAETGDGGKAVCAFQKMGDLCGPLGKGTEHDSTVGDGFVAWDCKFSVEICKFFYFHNNRSLNIKFNTAKTGIDYITYKELDESIWRLLHICCIDTEFV